MADPLQQFQSTLKANKLSLTYARKSVFAALQNKQPQSINQLIRACPDIDRVTVYRAVDLFERLGIVKRLQIGWKYKLELSDQFHDHHHHLSCEICGQVIHFDEDQALENRLHALSKAHGFKMRDHQLEIQGICKNCLKT